MSETTSGYDRDEIGTELTEDDRNVLHLWRESLTFLDDRYNDKVLLRLADRSMRDPEFRARLVDDAASVLAEIGASVMDGLRVRFFANTPDTVNVVLPPPAGEVRHRTSALRDALRSRTSGDALFFLEDDWNISDPGGADPPIFLPPKDDAGVDPPRR
ncbi:MAG: hypothetical protein ACJ73S_17455 [Mycobacteriales bacterium]|jgi:hypothetical protein